ncbi:11796_t:CDS:2, partial [Cetraspora pellucida]
CMLIVDGELVNLFELDEKGHLIVMSQIPYHKERLFLKSQNNLEIGFLVVKMVKVVPVHKADSISISETIGQLKDPFTLIFIIEVEDIEKDINNSKFVYLDEKIKNEYFVKGTSVQLCWLIDS